MASAVAEPPAKAQTASDDSQQQKQAKKKKAAGPLEVHVIGLSHHNAAVEVREKLSIPEAEWNSASAQLCSSGECQRGGEHGTGWWRWGRLTEGSGMVQA